MVVALTPVIGSQRTGPRVLPTVHDPSMARPEPLSTKAAQNDDPVSSYVEVRIYPGTDTMIVADFYANDMPVIRISSPDRYDLQIRPEAISTAGEAELAAAEALAEVSAWYLAQIKEIAANNRRHAADDASAAKASGGTP